MEEITIKLKYELGNYKGHGEVEEILNYILKNEIKISLEDDDVIKKGWELKISKNK